MTDVFKAGSALISRAVTLENDRRLTEALVCYQEGLKLYMDYMKVAPPRDKISLKERIDHFMTRAEVIKGKIDEAMKSSTYHEEIAIEDDTIGHSYDDVFGRFLKQDIEVVKIEDPYIRSYHQFQNFLRLSELLIKKCPKLIKIILVSILTQDPKQQEFFHTMKNNFKGRRIDFEVRHSTTLHDRRISLSNGWVIKMGRGLDYFKPVEPFSFGTFDMDLRKCHKTTIDIFCTKNLEIE